MDIKKGPTQKVCEACGGHSQIIEVPRPPPNPINQAHQLMGECQILSIMKVNDNSYQSSISNYEDNPSFR